MQSCVSRWGYANRGMHREACVCASLTRRASALGESNTTVEHVARSRENVGKKKQVAQVRKAHQGREIIDHEHLRELREHRERKEAATRNAPLPPESTQNVDRQSTSSHALGLVSVFLCSEVRRKPTSIEVWPTVKARGARVRPTWRSIWILRQRTLEEVHRLPRVHGKSTPAEVILSYSHRIRRERESIREREWVDMRV
jgi:hypothetical protein